MSHVLAVLLLYSESITLKPPTHMCKSANSYQTPKTWLYERAITSRRSQVAETRNLAITFYLSIVRKQEEKNSAHIIRMLKYSRDFHPLYNFGVGFVSLRI